MLAAFVVLVMVISSILSVGVFRNLREITRYQQKINADYLRQLAESDALFEGLRRQYQEYKLEYEAAEKAKTLLQEYDWSPRGDIP